MKKGFTLIELLGVIVVLGVIAVIAIPVIDNSINKNKEELYQTQINQIIKGTEDYYASHIKELPKNNGETKTKTIRDLQNAGNLPLDIKNPKTGNHFPPTTTVTITKINDNYKYTVNEGTVE